jgi:hypothetical protein
MRLGNGVFRNEDAEPHARVIGFAGENVLSVFGAADLTFGGLRPRRDGRDPISRAVDRLSSDPNAIHLCSSIFCRRKVGISNRHDDFDETSSGMTSPAPANFTKDTRLEHVRANIYLFDFWNFRIKPRATRSVQEPNGLSVVRYVQVAPRRVGSIPSA